MDDTITVDVDSDAGGSGRTRIVLSREGGTIETFRNSAYDMVRFDLSTSEAATLFEVAAQFDGPVTGRRSRGLPDEPRYRVILCVSGTVRLDDELWRSEIEADPILAVLQAVANAEGRALLL